MARWVERLSQHKKAGETAAGLDIDYRLLIENSRDLIVYAHQSPKGVRYLYASPATQELFGWSGEEFLKLTPHNLYTEDSLATIRENAKRVMHGVDAAIVCLEAIRKDGTRFWLENRVRILKKFEDGTCTMMISMRDITERKLLERQLQQQALTDGLTGVGNRRAFDEAIERDWNAAVRTGLPLSLILMDLDCFKLLNDTYGHQAGDDCLRAVAGLATSICVSEGGFVARFGGEEFAVLLAAKPLEQAERVANRICGGINALGIPNVSNVAGGGLLSVSCGVSTALPLHSGTPRMPEGLIFTADRALYESKRNGRNRVSTSFLLTTADNVSEQAQLVPAIA